MSGGFRDLNEFFAPDLELPIGGVTYSIPPIDSDTGLRFQALFAAGVDEVQGNTPSEQDVAMLDDIGERDMYRDALGPAFEQMRADGVTWPALQHAAQTAFLYFTAGEEAAQEYWESAGGKPPAREPQDHKAKGGQTARSNSPNTVVANTTQRRASTSGTTSRSGSAQKQSSKANASRGRGSSKSGRS